MEYILEKNNNSYIYMYMYMCIYIYLYLYFLFKNRYHLIIKNSFKKRKVLTFNCFNRE